MPTPADPDAHRDVVRAAGMLRARWGGAPVAVAYTAGSPRTVDAAVRALRQAGARQVAVAPYTLMPGMGATSVRLQAEQAGACVVAETCRACIPWSSSWSCAATSPRWSAPAPAPSPEPLTWGVPFQVSLALRTCCRADGRAHGLGVKDYRDDMSASLE